MRSVLKLFLLVTVLPLLCSAQQIVTVDSTSASPNQSSSYADALPTTRVLTGSGEARSADPPFRLHPYLYGGLVFSDGASYSPASATVGGGLDIESGHFIGLAEGSFQNAQKNDSGTGTETDLKGRAFFRTSRGWFFGGGAQWSKLGTIAYTKEAGRPALGGGKDLFRENFSMRAQVLYVLPGTDHLNAVQGPEISLWMPSPASRSHFFYRQTVGIYEFHQTSVPGNPGTNDWNAATFMQFTAMCRF
jgi:hypothetical protein